MNATRTRRAILAFEHQLRTLCSSGIIGIPVLELSQTNWLYYAKKGKAAITNAMAQARRIKTQSPKIWSLKRARGKKYKCLVCTVQVALTKVLARFARVQAVGTFFDARACGLSHLKSTEIISLYSNVLVPNRWSGKNMRIRSKNIVELGDQCCVI